MQLINVQMSEFHEIYSEMEKNFVLEERRDFEPAYELLKRPEYHLYHIVCQEQKVGFMAIWSLDGFGFIEHFVIYGQYRNCGYGSEALACAREQFHRLVLEVEPPEDELRARRIAFYERNGFRQNDIPYVQPPFRSGESGVELILMSCPAVLRNYEDVVAQIYRRVYGTEARN